MKGLLKAGVMLNCNANVIPQLSNWGKCQLLEGEDLSASPSVCVVFNCVRMSPGGPRSQVSASRERPFLCRIGLGSGAQQTTALGGRV